MSDQLTRRFVLIAAVLLAGCEPSLGKAQRTAWYEVTQSADERLNRVLEDFAGKNVLYYSEGTGVRGTIVYRSYQNMNFGVEFGLPQYMKDAPTHADATTPIAWPARFVANFYARKASNTANDFSGFVTDFDLAVSSVDGVRKLDLLPTP